MREGQVCGESDKAHAFSMWRWCNVTTTALAVFERLKELGNSLLAEGLLWHIAELLLGSAVASEHGRLQEEFPITWLNLTRLG